MSLQGLGASLEFLNGVSVLQHSVFRAVTHFQSITVVSGWRAQLMPSLDETFKKKKKREREGRKERLFRKEKRKKEKSKI